MANYLEVTLWLPDIKLNALKKALAENHETLESRAQEKLEELYREVVPEAQRASIDFALKSQEQQDRLEMERKRKEKYRVTSFQCANGENIRQWRVERDIPLLELARVLRKALRQKADPPERVIEVTLGAAMPVEYDAFLADRFKCVRGQYPVANAYVLNFDEMTLSCTVAGKGVFIYRMQDVSTSIFNADRARGLPAERVLVRFDAELAKRPVRFIPEDGMQREEESNAGSDEG